MKKVLVFFIGIFILLFINLVFASDVAYIYKSTGAIDENVVNVFKELGLSVELINENNLPSDFSNYKFVFIGDERFRNDDRIKIWEFPAIVSNYFFGPEWGLTDADGISKLAANSPLMVRKDDEIIQVYTQATFDSSTVGIPYYYLADENRDQDLVKITSPYLNNGDRLGAVTSYGSAGITLSNGQTTKNNICFFGIIESNYWTPEAKELFKECVGFVGVSCNNNNDCPDEERGELYCVGKKVFQDIEEFECENPGTFQSQCVDDINNKLIKECVSSCSNGKCICLDKDNDGFDECNKGDEGDDHKQIDCNDNNANINPGATEVCNGIDDDCDGLIDELSNNCQENEICSLGKCVEIACNKNSDCGTDGFIDSSFCKANDIYQNFQSFTCLNPGTLSSSCNINIDSKLISTCSLEDVCSNGVCVDVFCHNNSECNDNNHLTLDQCLNQGTSASECSNTPINCASDIDCGVDGFVGNEMCSDNDVIKNFQDAECNNPGMTESFCTIDITPKKINECEFACVDSGVCVSCNENSDCNDNKENTEDSCVNPGKINSFCKNEEIKCFNNHDCNDNNVHTQDTCVNHGSVESFCSYEEITCLNDNDCGTNGFVDGVFCDGGGNNDLYQNYVNFTCENPGTISSSCTKKVESKLVTDCQDSCSQGMCISFVCKNDLDCNDNKNNTKDVCVNPGTLDSHCSYETIGCLTNNDCNDNNAHTLDICNNPGSVTSFCSYQDIICLVNSDCGTNGFVGGLFCDGSGDNDVYQNFVEFSCENPGTISSSCTQTISSLLVNDCSDMCSDGVCIDIVCNNDLDCNDNNKNTVDVCIAPGEIDSHCSHEEIACVGNSDCGTNRFTGELFCQGKDLYRNFIDFSCNNAGTEQSFCSSNVNPNFISSCTYACSNGECIRCNNNLDCNDNNENTVDFCRFGGTSDSFCDYQNIVCRKDSDCNDNNNLTLDQCRNPGTALSECTNTPINCLSDSDCGLTGFVGTEFCSNNNVIKNFQEAKCNNPGTTNSFCKLNVLPTKINECEFACTENGVCITCNENSDCNDNKENTEDSCVNPGKINSFCKNEEIKCFNNNDCNDNNSHTQDICENPGTVDSFCDYQNIICNENSDCGTDKFIDGEFCSNNGVFKNFKTFTCLNSGTTSSSCTSEIEPKLIQQCTLDQTCSNGTCLEVMCKKDIDCGEDKFIGDKFCKDGDVFQNFKVFSCINPGSQNSECLSQVDPIITEQCEFGCSNGKCTEQIKCSKDSDCGIDGFVDNPFCEEGNVHKKFNDYTCLNPGTSTSSCNLETTSVVVEDCDDNEVCSNGMCVQIKCSKNSDCGIDGFVDGLFCQNNDVYQNFQSFTCLNPGTLSSSCNINIDSKLIKMCGLEDVCSNGMCLEIACSTNSDCNDNNNLTLDQCVNPGTPASKCINTPINCASDIDCGVDGFVGNEMCSDNDVIKNFQDAECNNPGTTESFCTIEVGPKLIDQCQFACIENGVCIRCDDDSDCNDNNESTKDTCINPKTKESFCKNEKEDICNAELKVQFDYIDNKKKGNLEPKVFVGENEIEFGNNEAIPLMKNGVFITDSDYVEDVPGIALQRMSNGKLKFLLFGGHNEDDGKEILAAKLIFDGAVVTGFENDLTEPNKKVDGQGNGKYELGDPEKDEVYVDNNDKEILWFSTVHTGGDGFFLDLKCEI